MKLIKVDIIENKQIARDVFSLLLLGDFSDITAPGQFVNLALPGKFLRRPLSVCRVRGETLTLVYKTVGEGTELLSRMEPGQGLSLLSGLGNGFNLSVGFEKPLLVGGGLGAAPLYYLAEKLVGIGKKPSAVLGFNSADEIILAAQLAALGVQTVIATADGSAGVKGFATDAIADISDYDYIFACGPEPMLRAVYALGELPGQYSFESRMACGFGACMCCTCETNFGYKRICKDGPVLQREEIKWRT
jgi:dihydroorotate dehydrogenase electron transfer subunit